MLYFSKILLIILIFTLCFFYFQRKRTFELQRIHNSVIYFAVANSAWMTAACFLIYSGIVIGSFFPFFKVDRIGLFVYLPQSIISFGYSFIWFYEYWRLKKRLPILIIAILHLGIAVTLLLISFWGIAVQKGNTISFRANSILENVLIILWFTLFFLFVIWHLIAPFLMNWKKWLKGTASYVFYEAVTVFFMIAFPFTHYILLVLYTGFNQHLYFWLFLLSIILFIMFSLFDIYAWLTASIMPKNNFFKSFKAIFFWIFPLQCLLCLSLFLLNIF
ncbi:MAG: hypothetical protein K6U80_13935 [Firmicutes bacterium]|nr:hypothetical protein [Bacillota bacterium]